MPASFLVIVRSVKVTSDANILEAEIIHEIFSMINDSSTCFVKENPKDII